MLVNSAHPIPSMIARAFVDPNQLACETAVVVLAGGKGTRLGALTRHECKPSLPFGGFYRNIDFSLSNCINSGIYRIGVATQYREASLIQHLSLVWRLSDEHREGFVEPWRAEVRAGGSSYRGTADAVFQNWDRIEALDARLVLILAGDHVYKMDYRPMLMAHVACEADITVGSVEIPIESASDFGVMSVDAADRIFRFSEKPCHPDCLLGLPDQALGSMGIYVFNRELLGRLLREDALTEASSHDFGRDLLPRLIDKARVYAYPFTQNAAVGAGYWRDVGTISAYWRAHMELLDGIPGFHLDDATWPVRSIERSLDATLFGTKSFGPSVKIANSLIAGGCKVDRATVRRAVLFANVSVAPNTELSNAIVLPNATIGRDCRLTDVVIGAGVRVPDGTIVVAKTRRDSAHEPTLVVAETGITRHFDTVDRHQYSRNRLNDGQLQNGMGA